SNTPRAGRAPSKARWREQPGTYTTVLFFFQAEDGIRDRNVTGVQTCALPISIRLPRLVRPVSIAVPATSSRTGPYVFFKFDVMVPAPRFAQRPITECPMKPSCALLA